MDDINKRSASDVDSVTSLMQSLYQRAEAALGQRVNQSPEQFAALSPAQAQRTLHDLQVHQLELEMQNEELRRTQVELDESLARYVNFYDLAPLGYCTVNEKGLIKEVNLTTSTLLNVPRSQLLKQPISRFIFNNDQDTYYKLLRKPRSAGGPLSSELRLLKRDGEPFWVKLEVAKVGDGDDGSELRLVISHIAERKNVETTLHASEMRYRSLIEWMPEPVVVHAEGKTLYVNPAAVEMFGASSASNLVGRPMLDLVHPDFRKTVSERVTKKAEVGQNTPRLEQKLLKLDGSAIDVEVQGTQIYYDGKPAVLAAMRDITKRKQAEATLRESEQRYRTAFQTSVDVININRLADGVFIDINEGFTRLSGWSREEVLGKSSAVIGIWHNQADRQKLVDALKRDGFCKELEFDFVTKNGKVIRAEMSARIMMIDDAPCILSITRDITERRRTDELVRELAYYDPLTGLANRMLLRDRLTQSMASGERSGNYGALMFLDLDNFKPLNDQHGHGAGDLLLAEVARRLKSCVRQIDTVARFGGDEFVVLLDDLTSDNEQAHSQADLVAEKIRSLLADPYVIVTSEAGAPPQTVRHHGSVSIGVTLFLGQESTQEDILIAADLAMYRAKDLGGNTVCFFDAQMQLENTAKAVLHQELRHGIAEQQFYVHYQAQLRGEEQISGVEALLRWQHPTRGWVTPAEFIETAEKTGLILRLGLWVLETARTQLSLWSRRSETAHLTMAVNVSARQFHHSNFVDQVLAVLERTGANPKQLTLELTESVLVTDVEDVIAKMELLKAKGIRFSLDDFGTGYSSLAYLKRLPLDQLKIAQAFVRDILIDPDDAVIAKTVIVLANSLGLSVIAEGVETEAQRDLLAEMGCHNYQGYLFSQALPAHEFEALVKK